MAANLQDAITETVGRTIAEDGVLDVADAATKLAAEFGADSREIASQLAEAGLAARINMKMDTPNSGRAA